MRPQTTEPSPKRLTSRVLPRLAVAALFALLAACSTVEDLAPVSSAGAPFGKVAVSNPRFGDNDPHEWTAGAPWHYSVHGTDVSNLLRKRSLRWALKEGERLEREKMAA